MGKQPGWAVVPGTLPAALGGAGRPQEEESRREDAWQSPRHARCHEFTHFLPLRATRLKKATFSPLFRCAQGDAALAASRPHPGMSLSLSLRVPALLSPRFPLCPNPLTHRSVLAAAQSRLSAFPFPCGAAIGAASLPALPIPPAAQHQHKILP